MFWDTLQTYNDIDVHVYYWHKVKHIQFVIFIWDLERKESTHLKHFKILFLILTKTSYQPFKKSAIE